MTVGDGRVELDHFCPEILKHFKSTEKEFKCIFAEESN